MTSKSIKDYLPVLKNGREKISRKLKPSDVNSIAPPIKKARVEPQTRRRPIANKKSGTIAKQIETSLSTRRKRPCARHEESVVETGEPFKFSFDTNVSISKQSFDIKGDLNSLLKNDADNLAKNSLKLDILENPTVVEFQSPKNKQDNDTDNLAKNPLKLDILENPSVVEFQSPKNKQDNPAYIKFRHLVEEHLFTLPKEYILLQKRFHALETCLMFHRANGGNCFFHKLKKPIENICNKEFSLKHLSQILYIFPDAYIVTPGKCVINGERVPSWLIEVPGLESKEYGGAFFAQETLLKRKKTFYSQLLKRVQMEHQKFLKAEKFNERFISDSSIWHPDFKLEDVPPIPEASWIRFDTFVDSKKVIENIKPLQDDITDPPFKVTDEKPSEISEKKNAKIKDLFSRIKNLETKMVSKRTGNSNNESTPYTQSSELTAATAVVKEVKQDTKLKAISLLDRIKAKEKKKEEEKLSGNTPEEKKLKIMLGRLPDIMNSVSFFFTSSKKKVMFMNEVVKKLLDSHKHPLTSREIEEHLRLLSEKIPEWITIQSIPLGTVLRLNCGILNIQEMKDKLKVIVEGSNSNSIKPGHEKLNDNFIQNQS